MPTDAEMLDWLAARLDKVGWAEVEMEIETARDDHSDKPGEDFRTAITNAMKVNHSL